jgi:predicted acylesterase/phospholipase RssA
MKKRPQALDQQSIKFTKVFQNNSHNNPENSEIGLVLSGGGARAAYQVGALRAFLNELQNSKTKITTVVGSSIGAVNGIVFSSCIRDGILHAVETLEELWVERCFRNTFSGSPSRSFFKALIVAGEQLANPGPKYKENSIFNPLPLMQRIDEVINHHGGLNSQDMPSNLQSVAVMTTVEGPKRRPLLIVCSKQKFPEENFKYASFDIHYVPSLSSTHGFASAALPSILPPVELDTHLGKVKLVDGGIAQNVPVDPALRMGAKKIVCLDISGRDWWLERYGGERNKHPTWELRSGEDTFCYTPPEIQIAKCVKPLGPLLKEAVGSSTKKFISAVGPVWPLYTLLRKKLGEEIAYETMSYVALDQDYAGLLIERGFNETSEYLKKRSRKDDDDSKKNAA